MALGGGKSRRKKSSRRSVAVAKDIAESVAKVAGGTARTFSDSSGGSSVVLKGDNCSVGIFRGRTGDISVEYRRSRPTYVRDRIWYEGKNAVRDAKKDAADFISKCPPARPPRANKF
jgi:hypothetical protein